MVEKDVEFVDAEILEDIANNIEPPNFITDPPKRGRGRPKGSKGTRKKDFPSFTPRVRESILQATSLGTPLKYAAKFAGVKPATLAGWLERGERAQERVDAGFSNELSGVEKDFAAFSHDYNQIAATAVTSVLGSIMKQAQKNPHIALKLLEKLNPQEFGQRQSIDMNVEGAVKHGHIHVNAKDLVDGGEAAKKLTTEELRQLRANIKQLPAGNAAKDATEED